MNATVEMFRKTAGPNRFSCPLPIWELLYELGLAFGWHPLGTAYTLPTGSKVEAPARRNYEPGESQDLKHVNKQDAIAWARALEKAIVSPHRAGMIKARSVAIARSGKVDDELLPGVIDEFIQFAYAGAFEFAIRREDSRGPSTD